MLAATTVEKVVFIGLFVLGAGAVIAVMISNSISHSREWARALDRVVRHLDARRVRVPGHRLPDLEFLLDGRKATFSFIPETNNEGPDDTTLSVGIGRRLPGALHIVPEGVNAGFLRMLGWKDLKVGDPDFDREYLVAASSPSFVAQVFAPERRAAVLAAVRRLKPYSYPNIMIRDTVEVQLHELFPDEEMLLAMVKTARELVHHLEPIPTSTEPVPSGPQTRCPVCETDLREGDVRCGLCHRAHHRECWNYLKRCSTYGCRGWRKVE